MRAFRSCCLLCLVSSSGWALDDPPSPVRVAFLSNNIVADVVSQAPPGYAKVQYPERAEVILGNLLSPGQARAAPAVTWPASPRSLYTLALVDPDAFSRENPNISEYRHWLVGNVPGGAVARGDVLAGYRAPAPPPAGGTHRYVFLVYEQRQRLTFRDLPNLNVTSEDRTRFSVREFSRRYRLGQPVAGNFFRSRFAADIC